MLSYGSFCECPLDADDKSRVCGGLFVLGQVVLVGPEMPGATNHIVFDTLESALDSVAKCRVIVHSGSGHVDPPTSPVLSMPSCTHRRPLPAKGAKQFSPNV
jgi:hypothetical protein